MHKAKALASARSAERLLHAEILQESPNTRFTAPRDSMPTGPAREFVLSCGRCELSPAQRAALVGLGASLPPQEWIRVATLAHHHRMESLVFKHVAEVGLLPVVPDDTAAALKRAYCVALVNNRRMQLALEALLAELREQQVEAMAVKGVALAAHHYHDIALRPANDIDLLVQRRDFARGMRALQTLDYLPAPGQSSRLDFFVLRYLEMHYTKAGAPPIELHLELVRNREYHAAVAVPELFARSQAIRIGGEEVRYLSQADELRYLSLHCTVQHRYSPDYEHWLWYVDLAELIRSLPRNWDWDQFVDDSCTLGVALPVTLALKRTKDLLGLELPASAWHELITAASRPGEVAKWGQARSPFARPAKLWQHLLSLGGAQERVAFVAGAAAGAPAFVRERVRRVTARSR